MRKRVTILVTALLLLLLIFLFNWLATDPNAPTFRPGPPQTPLPPLRYFGYEAYAEQPFAGGKVWLTTSSGTNDIHCYLFDLQSRKVLGELKNANPLFMTEDRTKVFCQQRRIAPPVGLREKILLFLDRKTLGKFHLAPSQDDIDLFWLLDLKRNSGKLVGRLNQFRGFGSTTFQASPDFRYAFNKPSTGFEKPELFICDLQKETLTRVKVDGWPHGWWDGQSIVLKTSANDFILYHVPTGTVSNSISFTTFTAFLAGLNDPEARAAEAWMFPVWTGKERHLYLSKARADWPDGTSYLVKIQPPSATLELVITNFLPEFPNHIDPTETWQLYSGTGSSYRGNGVFLRELRTGATRTLVPGDPTSSPRPSIPNFYDDTVIYIRDNALWQIDLTGSNNTRLFPSP